MTIELAPSILSANFARLAEDAKAALEGGGTVLHLDVMDGHFVPNITIGPPVVASLRRALPDAIFDCHLMIENPDNYIPAFAEAGANWISVHQEACVHLHRTLQLIESHGCEPAVVINPATPVHTLDEVLDMVHHVERMHGRDRKSTRLNSSHSQISYAVFCLKKKKKKNNKIILKSNKNAKRTLRTQTISNAPMTQITSFHKSHEYMQLTNILLTIPTALTPET